VGGSNSSTIHTAELLANAATNANTNNTIVKRDASGNFNAGTITAGLTGNVTGDLTGNASTSTKLAATKTIYGNAFDGSADLTQAIAGTYGGTGVNNGSKTITLGGNITTANNFTTAGNFNTTLTSTGNTNVTLPTTGTIATLAGTESLTNKTINGLTLTSNATGFSIAGGTTSKSLTLANDATISGTNTGDQTISLTGDVTGSGTGTFATTLANSGVTTGVYGGATSVPTITIDAKGRITNASNTTITGVSSIGSLLESGKIIVGDVNNQAAKVDMSGDLTINNTGVTSIGSDKVTTSKIANSNVSYAKIQDVSATNKILGRVSANAGPIEEISTIGTGNVVRAISPALTGVPTVPTAIYPSNDGTIASTQYVTTAINNISASSVSGVLPGANGGTGVNNTGKTITLGGNVNIAKNFTTSGTTGSNASDITFQTTGTTVLELPTSGKLATMSDVSSSSIGGQQITGIIRPVNGGTGVANDNTKLITLGGSITTGANLTTTGADITLRSSAASDLTLPTSGTIATLTGTETLTSKTIDASSNTILNLTNNNIASGAAITDNKLATISTAGKVANAATTATNANTANAIVLRDANGAFSAGSISASLNGNASTATKLAATKNIYGNAFDGAADLTNVIASTYGGTGNGFTKFTGPSSAEKTFTLPDATATILTTNALVTVGQGGTGTSTATQNYVFAGPSTGSSAGAPSFRALVAADLPAGSGSYIANGSSQQLNSNFNISGNGVIGNTLSAGTLNLTNALSIANGGTGLTSTPTSGQLDIGTSGGTFSRTTLTAGNGVSIANGNGSITISASGSGGTVTNVNALTLGTSGTDVNSSVANGTSTPTITLNIPDASASARGLVTTGSQTIAGAKTFSGLATFNTDISVNGLKIGKGNSNTGENTALGVNTLSLNTGNFNTAIGFESLKSNTSSGYNTGFGSRSITNNTTGVENTGIGFQSLYTNSTGNSNTALGVNSMSLNTTGSYNVGLGGTSLYQNTTGSFNTAIGRTALFTNTTGTYNTGIGIGADVLSGNLTNATSIGAGAVVTASNTVQVGNLSTTAVNTSGSITSGTVTYPNTHNNIANQVLTINASGTASFNTLGAAGATLANGTILVGNASNVGTAVTMTGDMTMTNAGVVSITAGAVSTAYLANAGVTYAKMQNISSGKLLGSINASTAAPGEVAIGTGLSLSGGTLTASGSGGTVTNINALTLGTSGTDVNSSVANSTSSPTITLNIPDASASARGLVTTGAQTIAGSKTFSNDILIGSARFGIGGGSGGGTGGRNIAMGIAALGSNTTGQWNVGIGAYALQVGSTASNNVAVGNEVMGVNAPGNDNTGVGNRSLFYNSGAGNTSIGSGSLNANTSGGSNTALGATAGAIITTGSNNTFIGYGANANLATRTNATAIGYGATVTADNAIQLGNTSVTNVKTSGNLTAGTVTYPNAHNSIANQVLSIDASGTATWAPNSSASLSGGVAGAIPYQSGVGVTGYTAAGTAGQILTSAGTSAPAWISTLPVANGGTGAATLASNAVLLGNGTGALQTIAPGTSGNVLTSNGTTWTSVAAAASGVSTIGTIAASSNAKGATISGTSLTLTPADGTNGGIVTTAAQTFAGTKSFADVSLSGALNGASTAGSTIAGFNAAIAAVTANLTISSANAATYNGKVLVCSGSAFTITFDSTVPVGFSCMILQSDNNTISFSGTNNRYNYSSTSGIYSIATAMSYASGSVLLTGDLQ
jgi:hypothetical protein